MNKATSFRPEDIRNVVLLGHGGTGKTTLAEAILHRCGAISRMGSVSEGNTTGDFEPEAKEHQHSTNSSLLFATHERREVNVIDTPGHPEFVGYALSALPAVETAIIVVSAATGIEFNTRRLFHAAGEAGLARMIVVNKIDGVSPAMLRGRVDELKEAFGAKLHCMNLPTRGGKDVIDCFDQEAGAADFLSVKDVHAEMLESTIEIDDAKLEKYLGGEKIDLGELRQTFVKAMAQGHVVPILFTSARDEVGVDDLLHILVEEAPSPVNGRKRRMQKDGELVEVACDADAPFMAHVFKVTNDPGVGQLAMLRVLQGKLDGTTGFVCGTDKKVRKAGHVLKVEGRDHPEFDAVAYAGDLVALARVEDIHVDQVLHDPALEGDWQVVPVKYPAPMLSLAVESKNRGDDVKLAQSLSRLAEEDPTFKFTHDTVTHELVLSGVGDVHLKILLERLKNRFKLDVTTKAPTVPYRETITAKAEGHYRHKKQTGGAGQFGEVYLRVEPLPQDHADGFEFVNATVGGSIPRQFMPAIEKGVRQVLGDGAIAGYPMTGIKVEIYDGKYHAVDSKEVAFITAGKRAFIDAVQKAKPALLEPFVELEVTAPSQYMGDLTGDLSTKRGRVVDTGMIGADICVIRAIVPLSELQNYSNELKSITGGAGSYTMDYSHDEQTPPHVMQEVVAAYKPHAEED